MIPVGYSSKSNKYILHTDGGSRGNPGPAAWGAVLYSPDGKLVGIDGKYLGEATNNEAEYEGIIQGLLMATRKNIKDMAVYVDSDLACKQITGKWKAKAEHIRVLRDRVLEASKKYNSIEFHHTPRENNSMADRVVNIVLDARP